jgi:hypothetical protein
MCGMDEVRSEAVCKLEWGQHLAGNADVSDDHVVT